MALNRDQVFAEFSRRAFLHGNFHAVLDATDTPIARKENLLVGIEGSVGEYDLPKYRSLKNKEALEITADFLLSKSFINGPEFFGLTAEREPTLWGIEDESL